MTAFELPLPFPEGGENPYEDELPPDHSLQASEVPKPGDVCMERCFALVYALGKAVPNPAEGASFDPILGAVLWQLMGAEHERSDDDRAVRVPVAALGNALNLTAKQVRSRLERLAEFGLIACVNSLDDKRKFYAIGHFYFNPLMVQLVLKHGGRKVSKSSIEPFITMGLARHPALRRPQGWKGYDVEYGQEEPAPGTPAALGAPRAPWAEAMNDGMEALEEAAAIATAVVASKSLRAQERLRRGRLAESFVRGCATVWQQAHERRGHGTGRPAWEGPYETLSPENKKQFRELRALFERFGGSKTAMAWACFCNGIPALDEKGRTKFLPDSPHVQWVSSDKKPSHFAKHWDALGMDPNTKRLSADEAARGRIAAILGGVFDAPPAPPIAVAAQKGSKP